ncbi:MAG: response regulator [Planctomycetes bacterium]|nr:response regulator [Planctomycetota bacterium]
MDSITEKILEAFQIEHREHLTGIRGALDELATNAGASKALDEAFRMAHSLKGGARVCGLDPIERVGHQIEAVFGQVRDGTRKLDRPAIDAINEALDKVEDWMSCLVAGDTPSLEPAANMITSLLAAEVATTNKPGVMPVNKTDSRVKLRAAFEAEWRGHLTVLRQLTERAERDVLSVTPEQVSAGHRAAHSLKGAAHIVELDHVADLSKSLEKLLAQVRDGVERLEESTIELARSLVEQISRAVEAATGADCTPKAGDTNESDPQNSPEGASLRPRPGREDAAATVRVSADSLDRLLRSAHDILSESSRQREIENRLDQMRELAATALRGSRRTRGTWHAVLRRLETDRTFAPLIAQMRLWESQLRQMDSLARSVRSAQKRSSWSLRAIGSELQGNIREARMINADSVLGGFGKMVRDLADAHGVKVRFKSMGMESLADRVVLQMLKDPVMHILRNAVSHGLETPPARLAAGKPDTCVIELRVTATGNRLEIDVVDDGQGLDIERIVKRAKARDLLPDEPLGTMTIERIAPLIFAPGFSTCEQVNDVSGRGMGLSVVQEAVDQLQGFVRVKPAEPYGTHFVLSVPVSIATQRLLLVRSAELYLGIPVASIDRLLRVPMDGMEVLAGSPSLRVDGAIVPIVALSTLIGRSAEINTPGNIAAVVVLRLGDKRLGVVVDQLLNERDAVVKPIMWRPPGADWLTGGILLEDESIALVVNPHQLVDNQAVGASFRARETSTEAAMQRTTTILVVDDSFTTRTLEKSVLESYGYRVRLATNGTEAISVLRGGDIDLVISDVEMPQINGFDLTTWIRKNDTDRRMPIILVTSLESDEHKERGMNCGADAYIVKKRFDHERLIEAIQQLV